MLERFNRTVVRDLAGRHADLVLVLKGERLSRETVEHLRQATGAVWVNFYPDDPFSDVGSNRLAFGPSVLTTFDHCFTFAGHLVEQYRAVGVRHVSWLPFARDPEQHTPVRSVDPPEFDVVFVGNLDANRVQWLEPVASRHRIAVFGERTRAALPRRSALHTATFLPAAYGIKLSHALARGAISLNVMRYQNRLSHNMRSFESLACGAFTLSQRTPELTTMFRENEEVAFVNDPEQLAERLTYWLSHVQDRNRIAVGGFRRVEHDTYAVRARTMLEAICAYKTSGPSSSHATASSSEQHE
jgi:spore maturation protein CgeB